MAQRAALAAKAAVPPHVLVMSATPIPRTLSLVIYGDLEVSVVDELPPGRSPVATYVVGEDKRQRMYNFVRKLVEEGRQAYMVCPAVEEGEDGEDGQSLDLKAAVSYANTLQTQVFPDQRVGLVPREDEEQGEGGGDDRLCRRGTGRAGVHHRHRGGGGRANAALMVVENADRFGLSQLHQLRGRVGRGKHQSYCVLVTAPATPTAGSGCGSCQKPTTGLK